MPSWWKALAIGVGVAACAVAVAPEGPAVPLTPPSSWTVTGDPSSRVPQSDFPWTSRYVRTSTLTTPGTAVFRTWTPTQGVVPLTVVSGPFVPTPYMTVAVTGAARTPQGRVRLHIACDTNAQTLPVLAGSVNNSLTEAVVVAPEGWCPGTARLVFASHEVDINVGAGTVSAISRLSYLKTTAFGRLPYLLLSLIMFTALLWTGAALARRRGHTRLSLPYGLAALGLVSLLDFYLVGMLPVRVRWFPSVLLAAAALVAWLAAMRRQDAAWRAIRPFVMLWWLAAIGMFLFQGMGTAGAGHWDPNYRFWPAVWSSDHELPWLVAQGVRWDLPLKGLFPPWLPTDRPPLMAGANLLLFEPFRLMQWLNDGPYLRGHAFNASAVALGALWIPVAWWFLALAAATVGVRDRLAMLAVVALTPLSLFNTQYGWPKSLSGAFMLLALTCAWRTTHDDEQEATLTCFFLLGACAVMSHASAGVLVGPVALSLLWRHRHHPRVVVPGMALALLIGGAWGVYRAAVLPSPEPLIRYALAGDFGFADPPMSVPAKIRAAYGAVDAPTLLGVKARMAVQPFVRVTHAMSRVDFNTDIGAGLVDSWRRLDVMLLAPGNAGIPLLVLLGGLAWWRRGACAWPERSLLHAMLLWVLITWALLVVTFLAPPVTPHWPLGILVGAALSGAVLGARAFPVAYRLVASASVVYAIVVWGILPLAVATRVDTLAATLFVVLGCALVMHRSALEAALDPGGTN